MSNTNHYGMEGATTVTWHFASLPPNPLHSTTADLESPSFWSHQWRRPRLEGATLPGSIHISPASRSAGERVFSPKYTPGRYEPQNRAGELPAPVLSTTAGAAKGELTLVSW